MKRFRLKSAVWIIKNIIIIINMRRRIYNKRLHNFYREWKWKSTAISYQYEIKRILILEKKVILTST